MSLLADADSLRTVGERILGEDRVPAKVLKRLRAAMLFVAAARRLTDRHRVEAQAAFRLDGAEAIVEVFDAAYDSELTTLNELVERRPGVEALGRGGGLPCLYMDVGTGVCGGCGASEAQGREESGG